MVVVEVAEEEVEVEAEAVVEVEVVEVAVAEKKDHLVVSHLHKLLLRLLHLLTAVKDW